MRAVVTGVAGFIGSTLADSLLADGWSVRGIDNFVAYYDRKVKERNLATALAHASFTFHEVDLREADLAPLLDGASVVFHQAAQAGVRLSWSDRFAEYEAHNVLATQRLLEAARCASISRFVYASSSSVYGDRAPVPTGEAVVPRPHSPYGVTKLAAEHLCSLYADNWGVPTVSLRYFTVYGPRQRPDMAIHRLIRASLSGEPFTLYGDGSQVRDFTFVDDVVAANLRAASAAIKPGEMCNIAGGSSTTMRELIDLVGRLTGQRVIVDHQERQAGDVMRTGGDLMRARRLLGWAPLVGLPDGVAAEIEWYRATFS